ncbi:MAG: MarR family transcriptional regulator [Actinomycetales bacterium]|nr:MarR family transcriptional regulator [Actinomycetales bacterium]
MDPRWLSDDEQVAWRRLIAVAELLPHDLASHLRDEHGMGMHEYWVLAMLSEAPDRTLRMRELARRAQASPSRVSHTIDRLEGRGWVIRQPSTTDRRGQQASLTAAGLEAVQSTAPSHVERVRQVVFDALDAQDVAGLARIMDRILARLDPTGERSPGGRY